MWTKSPHVPMTACASTMLDAVHTLFYFILTAAASRSYWVSLFTGYGSSFREREQIANGNTAN